MKTIWVIEQGEYSDYRVVGLFSSKRNADLVAQHINSNTTNERMLATVSEWLLDPAVSELNAGLSRFEVSMCLDGTVQQCDNYDIKFGSFGVDSHVEVWGSGTYVHAVVWAKDSTHAMKIVNEQRLQMIASGQDAQK